jgi:hypothetical protein
MAPAVGRFPPAFGAGKRGKATESCSGRGGGCMSL